MIAARIIPWLLAASVGLVAALSVLGGEDPYVVRLTADDAHGLRDGADVKQAGITIGTIALDIDQRDQVAIELKIDAEHAPIPADATIGIASRNLLGQKHVEILGGDPAKPALDGAHIDPGQLVPGTDLDDVLAVLDADTRTRLAIFLNEAGGAVAGRKGDLGTILSLLPTGMAEATVTVRQMIADNEALGRAVDRTAEFVSEMAGRRTAVGRVVDEFGVMTAAFAGRRAELVRTVAAAPGAVAQLRRFLVDLERTTEPLGPAAREISSSAPLLRATLQEVEPLRRSAHGTLRAATKVAPALTRLGDDAAPVVRAALPTTRSLTALTTTMSGLSRTLDKSVDNIFATADNWTRAIQFRDAMGHVFRGEATTSPDLVLSALDRTSAQPPAKRGARRRRVPRPGPAAPDSPARPGAARPLDKALDAVTRPLEPLRDALDEVVGDLLPEGLLRGDPPAPGTDSGGIPLLDYLLGD